MKKIIVGGDSFTDKNMPKHALPKPLDFKMWGELIGEKLNCEVINAAISGYGNQAIYHKTLDAIMNNKDADHVFVMWSEWTRQDFLLDTLDKFEYRSICVYPYGQSYDIDKWYDDSFNKHFPIQYDKNFISPKPSMEQLVKTNTNYMYSIKVICEKLNIPYTTCQAMNTGIESQTQITMVDLLKKEYGKDFKISNIDGHPNERSQKFIANKMLEFANE